MLISTTAVSVKPKTDVSALRRFCTHIGVKYSDWERGRGGGESSSSEGVRESESERERERERLIQHCAY